jgi:hypothetical protein
MTKKRIAQSKNLIEARLRVKSLDSALIQKTRVCFRGWSPRQDLLMWNLSLTKSRQNTDVLIDPYLGMLSKGRKDSTVDMITTKEMSVRDSSFIV